jgi:hypothetical protein
VKVKPPFLIETWEWTRPILYLIFDAGYKVDSLVLVHYNGKRRAWWVWASRG